MISSYDPDPIPCANPIDSEWDDEGRGGPLMCFGILVGIVVILAYLLIHVVKG